MTELIDFLRENVIIGACQCGKCIDAPQNPEKYQPTGYPTGHTSDVYWFKAALKHGLENKDTLKNKLLQILKRYDGEFNNVNFFDGDEHSFIEIGGYVGDQGLGLMLMGAGELFGLWDVLTPKNMVPNIPEDLMREMAGMGLVTIKVKK